jgi:hypothetical protein
MSYYVPPNNWTKNIPNPIPQSNGKFEYTVNVDSAESADPAVGCDKKFTASYKCGKNTNPYKMIELSEDAIGKTAVFDCSEEYNLCNNLKLELGDDGYLTLLKIDSSTGNEEELWTNKEIVGTLNNLESVAKSDYEAVKGKKFNSEIDGRNYLMSGEFLENDEWIGSPSGKFRLIMESGILKVLYNKVSCSSDEGPDSGASNLYEIDDQQKVNLGKMGYVNNLGKLQVYPDSMTNYLGNNTSSYEFMGNYKLTGTDLNTINNINSVNDCIDACDAYGTDITSSSSNVCAGIVFDATNNQCHLKDKDTVYTEKRVIDSNSEFRLRTKGIIDNDMSCPSEPSMYTFGLTTDWDEYSSAPQMSTTTKCGLANYTQGEKEAEDASYNALKNKLTDEVKNKVLELDSSYNYFKTELINVKNKLKNKLNELTNTRNEPSDWSGEQLEQILAMNEDSQLNMVSQNYKHILWSILAIIIVIATIRLTKRNAS